MRTPRWLVILYGLILILGTLIALPNLFSEQLKQRLSFWPDTSVTLGLDLRGGSELVLQLDSDAMKKERLNRLLDNTRAQLRATQIRARAAISGDSVVVTIPDQAQRQKARTAFETLVNQIPTGVFSTPVNDLEITGQGEKINLTLTETAFNALVGDAMTRSIEIVRNRIDKYGVAEPSIQRVQGNRIQVQLPGLQDPSQLRTLLGKTAKMTFHLVRPGVDSENRPPDVEFLPDHTLGLAGGVAVEKRVSLDGSALESARLGQDQNNQPAIDFTLNAQGAKEFAEITQKHLGERFAIVLDNEILTAPTINAVIRDGRGQITGDFADRNRTATLVALLQSGSLPAPLTVSQERTVGPDLGADAIKMGLYTGIVGFFLVAIFIFLLYGYWGIIADVALLLHTVLTFSALWLLHATLTLPGIAGIILGIGTAVDANILINERIREESRKGIGALAALDRGFKHAFATIVDANVTAIIATVLLYNFGTGPVKGFAITMMLGILISMFTDITVVRIIMGWVIRKWKIKVLNIHSFLNIIPQYTNFRFMNARFIGIGLSIVLSIGSLFLFFNPGLNYGIDFKGGIQIGVSTQQPVNIETLRAALADIKVGEVVLQNIGKDGDIMIRVQQQEGGDAAQTAAAERVKQTVKQLYPEAGFPQTEVIGPKVSGELAHKGLQAVIFASIAMSLYIWWRFEWFFAVGAMATLILDTTKMVGIFVLFQFDFNLTAIAALMTIVGYSVNDKVVVYDRMRENLRLFRNKPLREIIDMSINQVLVRCIFTSATMVFAMLPMAIWGGSAVHNFALPIVIGVIIATSSSIFIAAPILLFLGTWWERHRKHTGGPATAAKQP